MSDTEEPQETVVLKYPILSKDFDSNYEVLQVLKEEENKSHIIIEDLVYNDIIYLKRLIIKGSPTTKRVSRYYNQLLELSQSEFAHTDMVRLYKIEEFSLPQGDTTELLIFFEYGEPDCIALDELTTIQTIKFLKNITEILETTFGITKLTHNNISLENIVLIDESQLKLSGWKPLLPSNEVDEDYMPWTDYVFRNYGKQRLDICHVGLLWLELIEVPLDQIQKTESIVFPKFLSIIKAKFVDLDRNISGFDLLERIFNFDDKDLDYGELKLKFDLLVIEVEGDRIQEEEEEENKRKLEQEASEREASERNYGTQDNGVDPFELDDSSLFVTTPRKLKESDEEVNSNQETVDFNRPLEGSLEFLELGGDNLANMSFAENELIEAVKGARAAMAEGKGGNMSVDRMSHQERSADVMSFSKLDEDLRPKEPEFEDVQYDQEGSESSNKQKNFKKMGSLPHVGSSKIDDFEQSLDNKYSPPEDSRHQGNFIKPRKKQLHSPPIPPSTSKDDESPARSEKSPSRKTPKVQSQINNITPQKPTPTKSDQFSASPSPPPLFIHPQVQAPKSIPKFEVDPTGGSRAIRNKLWKIAESYFLEKQYSKSVQTWKELLEIVKEEDLCEIHKFLGCCYYYLDSSSKGIQNLEISKNLYEQKDKKQKDEELEASICKHLGIAYYDTKQYEKALELFLKSFEIKKQKKKVSDSEIVEMMLLIGDSEYNLGSYKDAIERYSCCRKVLIKADRNLEEQYSFRVYKKIGLCQKKLNRNKEAIISFKDALKNLKRGPSSTQESITLYSNIGAAYLAEDCLEEASQNYLKSTKLCKEIKFYEEMSRCFFYVGIVELKLKNYKNALSYFSYSLDARSKLDQPPNSETGLIHSQRGIVFLLLKNNEDAIQEFDQAISCFSPSRKSELAECYLNLGQAYLNLLDEERSIKNFTKSLKLLDSLQGHQTLKNVCNYSLGNIYFAQEDMAAAGGHYQVALDGYKNIEESKPSELFVCLYKLGKIWVEKDKGQSLILFDKALQIAMKNELGDKKSFRALFYRGYMKKLTSDLEGAFKDMKTCQKICQKNKISELYLIYLFLAEINIALDDIEVASEILNKFDSEYSKKKVEYFYFKGDSIEHTNLTLNYYLLLKLVAEKKQDYKKVIMILERLLKDGDPLISNRKDEMELDLAEACFRLQDYSKSRSILENMVSPVRTLNPSVERKAIELTGKVIEQEKQEVENSRRAQAQQREAKRVRSPDRLQAERKARRAIRMKQGQEDGGVKDGWQPDILEEISSSHQEYISLNEKRKASPSAHSSSRRRGPTDNDEIYDNLLDREYRSQQVDDRDRSPPSQRNQGSLNASPTRKNLRNDDEDTVNGAQSRFSRQDESNQNRKTDEGYDDDVIIQNNQNITNSSKSGNKANRGNENGENIIKRKKTTLRNDYPQNSNLEESSPHKIANTGILNRESRRNRRNTSTSPSPVNPGEYSSNSSSKMEPKPRGISPTPMGGKGLKIHPRPSLRQPQQNNTSIPRKISTPQHPMYYKKYPNPSANNRNSRPSSPQQSTSKIISESNQSSPDAPPLLTISKSQTSTTSQSQKKQPQRIFKNGKQEKSASKKKLKSISPTPRSPPSSRLENRTVHKRNTSKTPKSKSPSRYTVTSYLSPHRSYRNMASQKSNQNSKSSTKLRSPPRESSNTAYEDPETNRYNMGNRVTKNHEQNEEGNDYELEVKSSKNKKQKSEFKTNNQISPHEQSQLDQNFSSKKKQYASNSNLKSRGNNSSRNKGLVNKNSTPSKNYSSSRILSSNKQNKPAKISNSKRSIRYQTGSGGEKIPKRGRNLYTPEISNLNLSDNQQDSSPIQNQDDYSDTSRGRKLTPRQESMAKNGTPDLDSIKIESEVISPKRNQLSGSKMVNQSKKRLNSGRKSTTPGKKSSRIQNQKNSRRKNSSSLNDNSQPSSHKKKRQNSNKSTQEDEELHKYIHNFLSKIENLIEISHYKEADKYLTRFSQILNNEESSIDQSKIGSELTLKEILFAQVQLHKKNIKIAKKIAKNLTQKIQTLENYNIYKLYNLKIRINQTQKQHREALDACLEYLTLYSNEYPEGTLNMVKVFFSIVNTINTVASSQNLSHDLLKKIVGNQQYILAGIDKLQRVKFKKLKVPKNFFQDKKRECQLLLVSSALLFSDENLAQKYMNAFLDSMNFSKTVRVILLKEALETILASGRKKMCVEWLQKIDGRFDTWGDSEDKNLYFSELLAKIGSIGLQEFNYNEALYYFNLALDYYKKIRGNSQSSSTTNRQSSSLACDSDKNKILFDILYSIGLCCFEEDETGKASFFNSKAQEVVIPGSEDLSKSLLLSGRIQLLKNKPQKALKMIEQAFECHNHGFKSLHTIFLNFYSGKVALRLKHKEAAFNSFKQARKMLEDRSNEHYYPSVKYMIDEAFLNFKQFLDFQQNKCLR